MIENVIPVVKTGKNPLPCRRAAAAVLVAFACLIGWGCSKQSMDRDVVKAVYEEIPGPEEAAAKMRKRDQGFKGKSSTYQEFTWENMRREAEAKRAAARKNNATYAQRQARIKKTRDAENGAIGKNGSLSLGKVFELSLASPSTFKKYSIVKGGRTGNTVMRDRVPFVLQDKAKTHVGKAEINFVGSDNHMSVIIGGAKCGQADIYFCNKLELFRLPTEKTLVSLRCRYGNGCMLSEAEDTTAFSPVTCPDAERCV
jgi:hypothetical protein